MNVGLTQTFKNFLSQVVCFLPALNHVSGLISTSNFRATGCANPMNAGAYSLCSSTSINSAICLLCTCPSRTPVIGPCGHFRDFTHVYAFASLYTLFPAYESFIKFSVQKVTLFHQMFLSLLGLVLFYVPSFSVFMKPPNKKKS